MGTLHASEMLHRIVIAGATFTKTIHNDTYSFIDPTKSSSAHKSHSVFITGASKGIGRRIALAFAQSGASKIALGARSSLDSLESEILDATAKAGLPPPPSSEATSRRFRQRKCKRGCAGDREGFRGGWIGHTGEQCRVPGDEQADRGSRCGRVVVFVGGEYQGTVPRYSRFVALRAEEQGKDGRQYQFEWDTLYGTRGQYPSVLFIQAELMIGCRFCVPYSAQDTRPPNSLYCD